MPLFEVGLDFGCFRKECWRDVLWEWMGGEVTGKLEGIGGEVGWREVEVMSVLITLLAGLPEFTKLCIFMY